MRPTRIAVLVGIAAGIAVLTFAVADAWDRNGVLPGVPTSAVITLLVLAVAVLATAIGLRVRLRNQRERRPGARPVDPLVAARAVVLAKASSVVGSVFVGLYLGYGAYLLLGYEVSARRRLAITCGLCVLAGLLLAASALFLERVCRLPPPGDEDDLEETRATNG